MRLQHFQVRGFKNFRETVELDGLGAINVIHGENNVGKSNLLQAIDLFFRLLGSQEQLSLFHRVSPENASEHLEVLFQDLGYPPSEIFNLESPRPIEMLGTFSVDAEHVAAIGLHLPSHKRTASLRVGLHVARDPKLRYEISLTELVDQGSRVPLIRPDPGPDDILLEEDELDTRNWNNLPRLIQHTVLIWLAEEPYMVSRYLLIGTHRRVWRDRHSHPDHTSPPSDERADNIIPQSLLLALYDAKESLEPARYRRWELFVEVMQEFEDILGNGQVVTTFDRRTGKANLALQTASARIPISVQGSGVQQLVALLVRLLMSDATIIAIEEPELNLRFDLQRRLRDVLAKITASPAGPSQIFLTSHSPAFESGEHFYAMRATERGPVLERRTVEEAALFTTHTLAGPPQGRTAPLSYVSSDGLVQLPPSVRQTLRLEHGGGVVILKRDEAPYVEVLTNEQFLDLLSGPKRTNSGHDQG